MHLSFVEIVYFALFLNAYGVPNKGIKEIRQHLTFIAARTRQMSVGIEFSDEKEAVAFSNWLAEVFYIQPNVKMMNSLFKELEKVKD